MPIYFRNPRQEDLSLRTCKMFYWTHMTYAETELASRESPQALNPFHSNKEIRDHQVGPILGGQSNHAHVYMANLRVSNQCIVYQLGNIMTLGFMDSSFFFPLVNHWINPSWFYQNS